MIRKTLDRMEEKKLIMSSRTKQRQIDRNNKRNEINKKNGNIDHQNEDNQLQECD